MSSLAVGILVAVLVTMVIHFWVQANKHRADAERFRVAIVDQDFPLHFDAVARLIHANAVRHGFWPTNRNKGEVIALIHSEASELLEAVRNHIPAEDFSGEMEECADIIIRTMDYAFGYYPGLSLGEAITKKAHTNLKRPHKHDKDF